MDRFRARLFRAAAALTTIAVLIVVLGADRQW
jgi:hypothetical protein